MSADEFEIIRTLFAPLAKADGARGLVDDAAVLAARGDVVVTTDAIVEGVHFLPTDPIETVAAKALRVNVSDLVGKGARPFAALLTLVWPDARPAGEIKTFAEALGRDLSMFAMSLIGGDTASTPGPLTVSITAFGEPCGARTPSRADAKMGEDVWLIGGEIGSAWLGLQLRTGRAPLTELWRGRSDEEHAAAKELAGQVPAYLTPPGQEFDAEAAWLVSLSLAPFVRPECAPIISRFASASMDVSDGLVIDAQKLAAASGVKVRINAADVPLSIPAQRWVETGGDLAALLTGGDDYVFLFTAPPEARGDIKAAQGAAALRLSRIGRVEEGAGVDVIGPDGLAMPIQSGGFAHKLGR